jgi:hypothetical protein
MDLPLKKGRSSGGDNFLKKGFESVGQYLGDNFVIEVCEVD